MPGCSGAAKVAPGGMKGLEAFLAALGGGMNQTTYCEMMKLLDRLDALARAYRALSWLSECVSEVPADRVGRVMMPLDCAMEALLADFWALAEFTREPPIAPK